MCLCLITWPGGNSDAQLNLQNFTFLGVKGMSPRWSMQTETNTVGALATSPSQKMFVCLPGVCNRGFYSAAVNVRLDCLWYPSA